MIFQRDFLCMLQARHYADMSNCAKRKIGVYVPLARPDDDAVIAVIAANKHPSEQDCKVCSRQTCPAIHAEVSAAFVLARSKETTAHRLYIWAETPCLNCLSIIKKYTDIDMIYCLQTESYGKIYPPVRDRISEIAVRDGYAKQLGLTVIKLDADEILEYNNP